MFALNFGQDSPSEIFVKILLCLWRIVFFTKVRFHRPLWINVLLLVPIVFRNIQPWDTLLIELELGIN